MRTGFHASGSLEKEERVQPAADIARILMVGRREGGVVVRRLWKVWVQRLGGVMVKPFGHV